MKTYINANITIPRGYIVLDDSIQPTTIKNMRDVLGLCNFLLEENIILSNQLISRLLLIDDIGDITESIISGFKIKKGIFLREGFATKADIKDEQITDYEISVQLYMYFITYGLGVFDLDLFDINRFEKDKDLTHRIEALKGVFDKNNNTYKVLELKDIEEFKKDILTVVKFPIVFGAQQLDLINEANSKGLLLGVLDGVDFKVKENLFGIIDIVGKENIKNINIFKTSTDVLRYAYYVSGLDYSNLPDNVKFNLKTSDKRVIMNALDRMDNGNILNDMKPKKSKWIALSKNLFPGSKKFDKFTNAQSIFHIIRNSKKIITFNSITEDLISARDIPTLINHLSSKPGELMRRLDMIIRNSNDLEIWMLQHKLLSLTLSPKLMLQVKYWIKYRTDNSLQQRVFNVKGTPVIITDKPLEKLENTSRIIDALDTSIYIHLSGKKLLESKSVFIDERLRKYIVPTEIRNNSKSAGKIFTPGTRIKLDDSIKFIRLFTAWKSKDNNARKYDIDLGASFVKFNPEPEMIPITYYNQTSNFASHSGDFTSCMAFDGTHITAEYIDIDIDGSIGDGFEYVIISNHIFNGLSSYNEADVTSGVQLLDDYRVTKDKFININKNLFSVELSGNFQSHISLAVDLKTKEIVIIDQYSENPNGSNISSTHSKNDNFKRLYFNASDSKITMYELLETYCKSNNIELKNYEEAETILSYDDIDGRNVYNISNNLENIINLLN